MMFCLLGDLQPKSKRVRTIIVSHITKALLKQNLKAQGVLYLKKKEKKEKKSLNPVIGNYELAVSEPPERPH